MLEYHLDIFIVGVFFALTISDEINFISPVSLASLKMEKFGVLVSML
jgi:hypothetical protein